MTISTAPSAPITLISAVGELADTLGSVDKVERRLTARRKSVQAEIRKFERRGKTERNKLEREVKKARTRVERRVRKTRRDVEKQAKATRKDVTTQADLVSARVENVVQTGITTGTQVAAKVTERVASVA